MAVTNRKTFTCVLEHVIEVEKYWLRIPGNCSLRGKTITTVEKSFNLFPTVHFLLFFNDYARANLLLLICFLSQKMSERLIACTINCHGYCSILYQNAACLNFNPISALLIIQRKKCLLQKQFCSIVKYWIPHQSCKIRIRSKVVSAHCIACNWTSTDGKWMPKGCSNNR